MSQSNSSPGPAATAAPSGQSPFGPTPGNPPPRSGPPPGPGEREGGTPPPGAPRTPSAPPPPGGPDAGAGAGPGKPSAVSEWFGRLFGRPAASQDGAPDQDRDPEQPGAGAAQEGEGDLSPEAAALARQLAGLPADELSRLSAADGPFKRAVQSEIDRRTARANRQRDEQGRYVRQQRIEGLKQQARDARRTDVYKAAEIEEQIDGLQQQEAFVRGVVENYDRVSIDPIMLALPEPDRAALMADLPDGLEGRKQLVTAALSRLKEIWQAEATGRRPRPAANGTNGTARPVSNGVPRPRPARAVEEDEGDEPEVQITGRGRGGRAAPTMNDWLRQQMLK